MPQGEKILYEIAKGNAIDTGMDHFGAVIGNNCNIGTSVTVLPGKHIQANTTVRPDTIVARNINQ